MLKFDWRDKASWNRLGIVVTVLWVTFVTTRTNADLTHPLFDYIFILPIGVWLVILIVKKQLDKLPPK